MIAQLRALSAKFRRIFARPQTREQQDLEIDDEIRAHLQQLTERFVERGMSREDAYALISVGCDVDITQLVDTKSGVHVMCPKSLFTTAKASH